MKFTLFITDQGDRSVGISPISSEVYVDLKDINLDDWGLSGQEKELMASEIERVLKKHLTEFWKETFDTVGNVRG